MNEDTLRFEHEEGAGWRYAVRDPEGALKLMSTKYYWRLEDAVQDLRNFARLLEAF